MEDDTAALLLELSRQIGSLRQDLGANASDWEIYKARVARIDRMMATLADSFSATHPALANAITASLQRPEHALNPESLRDRDVVLGPPVLQNLLAAIEKVGLLRRDMQHRRELDRYQERMTRISDGVAALAERLSEVDPAGAKALTSVWQLPARSLAFRNAAHQKKTS